MTILGIDLGTTHSLVAVLADGSPRTLPNEQGEHLIPSAVAMASDGALLVGRAAWDRLVADPTAGQAFFKRDMGSPKAYRFGGREWTPIECSALVLGEMKRVASLHLGREAREAVVTVPAWFRDAQRQATREAANLAGLAVARILNEPTAAALAYGLADPEREQRQVVVDLGGGTLDVTALEVFSRIVEVRASTGESFLGGEDYTDGLLEFLIRQSGLVLTAPERGRLRAQVEGLKRRLSVQDRAGIVFAGNELVVTRQQFEQATAALTARIRPILRQCLRDAKLTPGSIDAVLLVGGATRMPAVQRLVQEECGKEGLATIDPDRAVALGAAVQAGLCARDAAVDDIVLTDVAAHTLGIETSLDFGTEHTESGYFTPIIERNTTVPVSRAKRFQAMTPSQEQIVVKVFQGEARRTKDNHPLGQVTVTGLRRTPPEVGAIEVRFTYDMSGLLEVDVKVLPDGERQQLVIEQRPGTMTPEQIERVLARFAPLKVAPRDLVHNRARIERANRVFERLLGEERKFLSDLLDEFLRLLVTAPEAEWSALGCRLDAFLANFPVEDGGWQPPPGGSL